MSNLLHACLYNAEPAASESLVTHIQGLNFVRFAGEVNSVEALAQLLQHGSVNLAFFHLDPDSDAVVEVIDEVSNRYPDLAMIAIGRRTDPESILAPMRAGCDQFVRSPVDSDDLRTAVARVVSKRMASMVKSRCICVTSAAGGSGSTTIACNLALEIGHLVDRDCALIDLDFEFGDVALNFDAEPKYSFHDLADAGVELDRTVLTATMLALPCKVALLARPESMEQSATITPDAIQRVIEMMRNVYENIVIDVPGSFDSRNVAALTQADHILVVCQLLVPSIRNTKRYIDALRRLGIPEDRIEVVANRNDGRSGRLTEADLAETIKKQVFASVPNDYQFVARSIDVGRPIAALDRNSPVRAAIRQIARKIVTTSSGHPEQDGDRKGFLSRLLAK